MTAPGMDKSASTSIRVGQIDQDAQIQDVKPLDQKGSQSSCENSCPDTNPDDPQDQQAYDGVFPNSFVRYTL